MKSESRREEKHSFVTCFLGAMDSHKIILLYFSRKIGKNLLDLPKFILVIYHSSDIYFSQVL